MQLADNSLNHCYFSQISLKYVYLLIKIHTFSISKMVSVGQPWNSEVTW